MKTLAAVPILTSYIPMLSGTGGNSGTQASTAVIRALSLGEVRFSDLLRVVWKECRVALICGVCLAAANFVKMMVVDCWLLANPTVTPAVAAVVLHPGGHGGLRQAGGRLPCPFWRRRSGSTRR